MSRTKVELALGNINLAIAAAGQTWTDWTAYVELDNQSGVQFFRGYRSGSRDPSATEIRFRGKNASKRWSLNNPNNPEFGRIIKGRTLIRVSRVDGGTFSQATGILSDVILGYSADGAYQYADVTAYGAFEREENQPPGRSVTYRQISQHNGVVSYLPGEDASGSTRLAQAVAGQPDATTAVDISYAADSDVPGSDPLWMMTGTSYVRATVAPYAERYPRQWAAYLQVRIPSEPAGTVPFFGVVTADGTIVNWTLRVNPGSPATGQVSAENAAGVDQLTGTTTFGLVDADGGEVFGQVLTFYVQVIQNGADIDWSAGTVEYGGQSGTVTGQTLGRVTGQVSGPNTLMDGWTQGQWVVTDSVFGLSVIWDGYAGSTTDFGWFVGAVDAAMPVDIDGGNSVSTIPAMVTGRAIDAMKANARAEHGLMYETTDGAARLIRRENLYNQSVVLTVDRTATPRPIRALAIIDDNQGFANRVAATTGTGDSIEVDAPYPNAPSLVGYTRAAPFEASLETVQQLKEAAEFEAMLVSHPDHRYEITLCLDGPAAALKATFLSSVDIGSRIQITNPQTGITLDAIDQQVMGIFGRMTEQEFDVTLNTRSALPWQTFVAETGSGNTSRADTAGCVLLAPLANGATSAIVGTNGAPGRATTKWSTSAVPYDLAIRQGERATCTAVANNAPTFVAAGTASHADNAAVTPGAVAGIAAGDLQLALASIRDSGGFAFLTGASLDGDYVGDQTGWYPLAIFGGSNGSLALYGRSYAGQSAPTFTPAAGSSSAGDTVSAQMCGFRYAQPVLHNSALPLQNASAANIAYPGVGVVRSGTVVLLIVQKDDDLTSTTAPAGFTKIADVSSTLGADQSFAWYYQIQTTAALVASGTVTVAGGAANTSKSIMISLCGDAQTLTLTRAVNGATSVPEHPSGTDVRLWRGGRAAR